MGRLPAVIDAETIILIVIFRIKQLIDLHTGITFLKGFHQLIGLVIDGLGLVLFLIGMIQRVTDSDTQTGPHKLGQIDIEGVMGKDGKEIPVTFRLTVTESDSQNPGTFLRILTIHLITVARTHENHRIRMFLLQVINLLDLCRFLIDDNLLGTFTTGIRLQSHYQGFVGLNLTQLHVICRDGSALVQPYALIGKSCIQGFNHQGRIRSIIIDIHAHLVGIVYEHLRRKPLRRLRK